MREAGIKSVRQPLVWRAIEPQNPAFSERQWGYMDHEVRLAAEAQRLGELFTQQWGTAPPPADAAAHPKTSRAHSGPAHN